MLEVTRYASGDDTKFTYYWEYENGAIGFGGEKVSVVILDGVVVATSYKSGLPEEYSGIDAMGAEEMTEEENQKWLDWEEQGGNNMGVGDRYRTKYTLTATWNEPETGHEIRSIYLTEEEADELQDLITWLAEGAGDNYGQALIRWTLTKYCKPDVVVGLGKLVKLIKTDSRYGETGTPGEYYGGRNEKLDQI